MKLTARLACLAVVFSAFALATVIHPPTVVQSGPTITADESKPGSGSG